MARRKKTQRRIESYAHDDKERVNNPPVGLVDSQTDVEAAPKKYTHDPHIDPEMSWAGKTEQTSFEVPTVSLHVHERIDPRTIIEAVRKEAKLPAQISLFESLEENPPIRKAIEFYKHQHNWTNRLIAGDSLLVMNSLLQKEGLGGQVQTVYIDPPYGITYGSNFQPFVNRLDVTDGKAEDLTGEPEQLRAFRDTWELGIHSYLTYLRDRLLLSRELLSETGSCFVQIGDENVHRVGILMDEVFGAENRVTTITWASTSGSSSRMLPDVSNYILWYAKDGKQTKFHQLYEKLSRTEVIKFFNWDVGIELANGTHRKVLPEERFDAKNLPDAAKIYSRRDLVSQGLSTTGRSDPYHYRGREFQPRDNSQWSVSFKGLDRLAELNRLEAQEGQNSLMWLKYEDEVPGKRINNIWKDQAATSGKRYVVETAAKIIQRCILMSSDPGDLVFDPTCGGGTTPFVAEQWGRRWISCDTSRVALTITKQRLSTAKFDYYELAKTDEGVGSGFVYNSVQSVSAASLAYDEPREETYLYDQPKIDRSRTRVTGPFTVDAVPAPMVEPIEDTAGGEQVVNDNSVARSGISIQHSDWRDELSKTGIRAKSGQRIRFSHLEPALGTNWIHADGESMTETPPQRNQTIIFLLTLGIVLSFLLAQTMRL